MIAFLYHHQLVAWILGIVAFVLSGIVFLTPSGKKWRLSSPQVGLAVGFLLFIFGFMLIGVPIGAWVFHALH